MGRGFPYAPGMRIAPGDLDDPRIVAILEAHLATMRATSPPESIHALDLAELRAPEISFWAGWDAETLIAVGALKTLSAEHGEIKSMHTTEAARGRGAGTAMLVHLIGLARSVGMRRLSLETGSQDAFAPARRLYLRHGFVDCPPFADYRLDPNSVFMTREMSGRRETT